MPPASAHVLEVSHGLEVVGLTAVLLLAQMVELEPFRNAAVDALPHDDVSGSPTAERFDNAIALLQEAGEDQAGRGVAAVFTGAACEHALVRRYDGAAHTITPDSLLLLLRCWRNCAPMKVQ